MSMISISICITVNRNRPIRQNVIDYIHSIRSRLGTDRTYWIGKPPVKLIVLKPIIPA